MASVGEIPDKMTQTVIHRPFVNPKQMGPGHPMRVVMSGNPDYDRGYAKGYFGSIPPMMMAMKGENDPFWHGYAAGFAAAKKDKEFVEAEE